jgi:hypothetical protein
VLELNFFTDTLQHHSLYIMSNALINPATSDFLFDFWCFNTTFSNISAISLRPVIVVEEAGVPGENHRPWTSN